ncbi:Gfo/Idh/MocA family oxidoreductase [Phragmitibacter flavus]|uniref:Gfo/Idh/MocA family oxidoreductase n=1 Tax=Phragmitibacter flavus TaxID=2576071 RepID=A0A5R8KA82_9BACT|nr:Gfo/Idh/MocA family oxidoreductase [Phragmitibacter flavus]TLD69232.1 Gfo/Idh/MocA family oxidoreductase [Phragmitibacter flavus]
MNPQPPPTAPSLNRRSFIQQSGRAITASALAGVALPHVHAAGNDTIQLALIGCGGRGSGAVANALDAPGGRTKMVAMADLYQDRLERSHQALADKYGDRVDVPYDRQFIGFDAFKNAIDSLRPGSGDIALLTGYAGFRPQQLEYAVERGVNVFMEKSFATDPVGVRRVMAAAEAADKKGIKIAAGLMCRHSPNREELIRRLRGGELGDLLYTRAYRMGPVGNLGPKPEDKSEMEWQVRNFTKFYWVSGGLWAEMDIHQVDELCWLHDALPVSAQGVCGRAANSQDRSQNLDSFNVEWTFPNGTRAMHTVRYLPKTLSHFATYVHGSKKAAQFSGNTHAADVEIYKNQNTTRDNIESKAPKEQNSVWQNQWNDYLDAIQNDKPFNQAKRAAQSNLAAIMGRAAMHMGRVITWDEAMASPFQWFPGIDNLSIEGAPPVLPDEKGNYPVPVPGQWTEI